MKTIRFVFVIVVLLGFYGCMRNIHWTNEEQVPEKEKKSPEMVSSKIEDSKLPDKGLVDVGTKRESSQKMALIFPKHTADKAGPALNKKVVSEVSPPKLVKLRDNSKRKDSGVKPRAVNKEAEAAATPAPVKKVKRSVSVAMDVNAEKAVSPKKSVSVTMDVNAEKTVLPKKNMSNRKRVGSLEEGSRIILIPLKKLRGTSQFMPKVMRVKVGEKVLWVNQDTRTHFINKKPKISTFSVMVDVGEDEEDDEDSEPEKKGFANSPLIHKGEKWAQVFTKKGTYKYYCFTHPLEMRGTIVVE